MRIPFWGVVLIVATLGGVTLAFRSIQYGLIIPLIVSWLAAQFVSAPFHSTRSKQVVVVVTVWATALGPFGGLLAVTTQLALTGVGVYTILADMVATHD